MKDSTKFKILHWIQFKVLKYNPPIRVFEKQEKQIKKMQYNAVLDEILVRNELPRVVAHNIAEELIKANAITINAEKQPFQRPDHPHGEYKVHAELLIVEP